MGDTLTKRQAQIVSAYTGFLAGPFSDFHEYAEELLERPVMTHEFGDPEVAKMLRDAAREDFMAICRVLDNLETD